MLINSKLLQTLGLQPRMSKKNFRSLEQIFLTVGKDNLVTKYHFPKCSSYPLRTSGRHNTLLQIKPAFKF